MIITIIILLILFLFLIYLIIDNFRIRVRRININIGEDKEYKANKQKREEEKEEYKIVHISDFHNRNWGNGNKYLLDKIKTINPDFVFISGDLIDHRKTNVEVVEHFLDSLNDILYKENKKDKNNEQRIFYVFGNHEYNKEIEFLNEYEKMIISKNVRLLNDEVEEIYFNNKKINIIGMDDPKIEVDIALQNAEDYIPSLKNIFDKDNYSDRINIEVINKKIENIFKKNKEILKDGYNILLSHRPEAFDIYKDYNIDLILTGHAHGGLLIIPFTNISLIAPNQGFLPKYIKGPYIDNNTIMYVNMGLGNSIIPIRIFTTPEIFEINIKI